VDTAKGVSRLVRIDPQSGSKEWLTDPPVGGPGDTEVAVSASGSKIVFQRNREEAIADIYTASIDGRDLAKVTKDSTGIVGLAWAYGGTAILASTRWKSSLQRLWWLPLDGSAAIALTDPAVAASWPAVSPRDGRIAYASRMFDTNVWRFDLQGSAAPRRVVASNVLDSGARLSPDGQRIAFRSNRGGNDEIWTSNREGEAVARLSKFGGPTTGSPYWSPDGKHLLFESRAGGKAGIYEVNAEGGPLRHLSGNAFDEVLPRYSRDGRSIYFATNRSGSWQIWKRKKEGGGDTQLTRGGGLAGYESDDGAYLYFSKRNEPGIYRVSPQGGAEELVFDGLASGMWGAWGLAGQRILYVSLNPPALQEYDLKTKSGRTITVFDSAPVRFDSSVSVSPDGHWALISLVERAGSTLYVEQKAETAN
jgi:Tol biopolymer transport system component